MKKFERIAIIVILFSVIAATYAADFYRQYTVPIIFYAHVGTQQGVQPLHHVSLESFEQHMAFLAQHQYHVISLDELVEILAGDMPLPRHAAVLTFDIGYAEIYHHVFPILKTYEFPATIFIASDDVNKQGFLTWPQIQEMQEHGIIAGSYGVNRLYLPSLSQTQQTKEIHASKKMMERRLGQAVAHFAYPFGGFTQQIQELVQEAGYVSAATTNRGQDPLNRDVYALNRIRLNDLDQSAMMLRAKLSGYYHIIRKYVDPD